MRFRVWNYFAWEMARLPFRLESDTDIYYRSASTSQYFKSEHSISTDIDILCRFVDSRHHTFELRRRCFVKTSEQLFSAHLPLTQATARHKITATCSSSSSQ